jgi:hypothetical protein
MNKNRVLGVVAACAAWVGCSMAVGDAVAAARGPEITVRFPSALSKTPLDGRVILLLSRDLQREPRTHVEPNMPLDSPYLFGLTVDGLGATAPPGADLKSWRY